MQQQLKRQLQQQLQTSAPCSSTTKKQGIAQQCHPAVAATRSSIKQRK